MYHVGHSSDALCHTNCTLSGHSSDPLPKCLGTLQMPDFYLTPYQYIFDHSSDPNTQAFHIHGCYPDWILKQWVGVFFYFFYFFFVAWGGPTGTTLAGRKILYAYILHDLARPTECYVGLFPKGTYPLKNSLEPPPWPTGLPYPERGVGSGTVRLSLDRPTPPADPTLKSGRVPTSQLCRRKASVWD